MKRAWQILLLLVLALPAGLAAAPPSAPPVNRIQPIPPVGPSPITPDCRYLFVVDTSSAMQRQADGLYRTAHRLVANGLGGRMQEGDVFTVWTYADTVLTREFPLNAWSQDLNIALANRAYEFLAKQKFRGKSNLRPVFAELGQALAIATNLTIVLVSDGTDVIVGTPFDRPINVTYGKRASEMRTAKMPFVTSLVTQRGEFTHWSVRGGLEDVGLPLPEKPALAITPVAQAPAVVPPVPTPALVPPVSTPPVASPVVVPAKPATPTNPPPVVTAPPPKPVVPAPTPKPPEVTNVVVKPSPPPVPMPSPPASVPKPAEPPPVVATTKKPEVNLPPPAPAPKQEAKPAPPSPPKPVVESPKPTVPAPKAVVAVPTNPPPVVPLVATKPKETLVTPAIPPVVAPALPPAQRQPKSVVDASNALAKVELLRPPAKPLEARVLEPKPTLLQTNTPVAVTKPGLPIPPPPTNPPAAKPATNTPIIVPTNTTTKLIPPKPPEPRVVASVTNAPAKSTNLTQTAALPANQPGRTNPPAGPKQGTIETTPPRSPAAPTATLTKPAVPEVKTPSPKPETRSPAVADKSAKPQGQLAVASPAPRNSGWGYLAAAVALLVLAGGIITHLLRPRPHPSAISQSLDDKRV